MAGMSDIVFCCYLGGSLAFALGTILMRLGF